MIIPTELYIQLAEAFEHSHKSGHAVKITACSHTTEAIVDALKLMAHERNARIRLKWKDDTIYVMVTDIDSFPLL